MARLTLWASECDAAIFDMDGVVTETARVHARAWKEVFDELLHARAVARGEPLEPFHIETDYRRSVDGMARLDGVRRFLASRGIVLPEGSPEDPPEAETVHGVGRRKNRAFLERLHKDGARRFEDAVDLVRRLHAAGIRTAVISASRNAEQVLEEAGVSALFETRVDGVVAAREGLAGKPAPDVFLAAAERLRVTPARSAVIEDAIAGVRAGRAGGFRWVIGVARSGTDRDLAEAGADAVVRDLGEIAVRGLCE